jgi:Transposase DDE domain
MGHEEYRSLPVFLRLREILVRVEQKGFRTRELVVITTLLDPEQYPATEIAKLYRQRWQAELHLRSLKIVLQMDHLRCKKPHRVRNEFYMHLVAYNLIRKVMALAAFKAGVKPWTVSFKGALQTTAKLLPLLHTNISIDDWCDTLLIAIATHDVGNRPDRFEPRLKKRRPKQYKHLREPRQNYKRQVA